VIVWAPLASWFLTDGFSVERLHADDFRRRHAYAQLELEPVRPPNGQVRALAGLELQNAFDQQYGIAVRQHLHDLTNVKFRHPCYCTFTEGSGGANILRNSRVAIQCSR